ncbi:hypothetical protein MKW94_011630 [Papaver nudicaule]|uniref:Dof zinc finger protein n=1 Tax=Papaver nudicaule TaxID=74823 RepID=A0AA42B1D7_PAPNU|nr:hypothetical protein [Papaver nudicaule]
MQDLRASMEMAGSSGGGGILSNNRFFGGIAGGDRRLRPFPNQSLKCPRCDSLNTKFCYYNNYNLSQPRHFCKSCRRYWTKGGVLRNVPVGGGIRKTKQQQKSSSSPSSPKHHTKNNSNNKSPSSSTSDPEPKRKKSNSNNSSSDSSSLTAATTTTTTHEAGSNSSSAAYHQQLLNFNDSSAGFASQTTTATNPNSTGFEPSMIHQQQHQHSSLDDQGIFQEPSSFTSLITTGSNHGYSGFNLSDISPFRLHHEQQEQQQQQQHIGYQLEQAQKMTTLVDELKMQFDQKNDQSKYQELAKNFYDQTVPVEMPGLPPNRTGDLTPLDWQSSNTGNYQHHQGLFDLPNTVVDHQVYWSQTSQWTEHDHPLYLP